MMIEIRSDSKRITFYVAYHPVNWTNQLLYYVQSYSSSTFSVGSTLKKEISPVLPKNRRILFQL
jgi:hypothetical protein